MEIESNLFQNDLNAFQIAKKINTSRQYVNLRVQTLAQKGVIGTSLSDAHDGEAPQTPYCPPQTSVKIVYPISFVQRFFLESM